MRVVVKAVMGLSRSELVYVNRAWLESVVRMRKASGGSGRCWRRSHCWIVVVVWILYQKGRFLIRNMFPWCFNRGILFGAYPVVDGIV